MLTNNRSGISLVGTKNVYGEMAVHLAALMRRNKPQKTMIGYGHPEMIDGLGMAETVPGAL